MLKLFIAATIAIASIAAQPVTPPLSFVEGLPTGEAKITKKFIGMKWSCGDETCFAGLRQGRPVTGP